ncbi:hypothetical protein MOQ17_06745 [Stenotrophomonas maltophilia]|nr:hypothetical protein [Stenotrophomonas maltophilia]MCI1106690.1 hypothetical protein [Stenotrophomonas maltophilia]
MHDHHSIYDRETLLQWYRPDECDLKEEVRFRFRQACAALTEVLTGELQITKAAKAYGLCRKRLRRMILTAPMMASDGRPHGFRVCVPNGVYIRSETASIDVEVPRSGRPSAMGRLLQAIPQIKLWVDEFNRPLPPGRAPKAFNRLHGRICAELRRRDLADHYPLNTTDKGRRALLDYMRRRRIQESGSGTWEFDVDAPEGIEQVLRQHLYGRTEFDAHQIDIEATLAVDVPGGGQVNRRITTIWLLIEIEVRSRAIVSWSLRVGRAYTNLDVALCLAVGLRPWERRELTIPGLSYAPGAGMPTGLAGDLGARRSRSIALDNALAHSAHDLEAAFCRSRGGVLIFGKARQPRSRPVVEQLFSRLERGALRQIPGGFEPAVKLGEKRIRISNFSPDDHPIQMQLFEELLDVIIANYNATSHVALGDLSPLQFLRAKGSGAFDLSPDSAREDADDMCTIVVLLTVHGDRAKGVVPHVNYMYVKYRAPSLDGRWEMIGTKVMARINRNDLRTILLMRSATTPLGAARAAAPWSLRAHDETTRKLIMRWIKNRTGFSILGTDCAIEAYVAFLKTQAASDQSAVDQLARMGHVGHDKAPPAVGDIYKQPLRIAPDGWISLDE